MNKLLLISCTLCITLLYITGCKKKDDKESDNSTPKSRIDLLTGGKIRKWKKVIPKRWPPCREDDLLIFSKQDKVFYIDPGVLLCDSAPIVTFTWELSHHDSVLTKIWPHGSPRDDFYIISLSDTKLVMGISFQDTTYNETYIAE